MRLPFLFNRPGTPPSGEDARIIVKGKVQALVIGLAVVALLVPLYGGWPSFMGGLPPAMGGSGHRITPRPQDTTGNYPLPSPPPRTPHLPPSPSATRAQPGTGR